MENITTLDEHDTWCVNFMINNFFNYPSVSIKFLLSDAFTPSTYFNFECIREQIIAYAYCYNEDLINN